MKGGIPWFPLDTTLDEKFELIEAEFGLNGFAVIVKLFQRIYGQQGYYCEWTNEVALLFSRRCGLGVNVVSEIVSAAFKRGVFDKTLYEKYHILTSKGIQERYFEAVSRRKNVEVKEQYLLISDTQKSRNANIIEKNVDISSGNADISKQSRVEKRKEEDSRGEKRRAPESPCPAEQRAELEKQYGKALVKFYIAKAGKYRYEGDKAVSIAAQWMAEDEARGKIKKAGGRDGMSLDMAAYQEMVTAKPPKYRKDDQA